MIGTKYACNLSQERTKYACNLKSKMDTICSQSLSIMTKYACNVENRPWVRGLWFLDESRENKMSMIASIFGPYWNRMQAYKVRLGFGIASIFIPFLSKTASVFGCLYSCLYLVVYMVASMIGPNHFSYCKDIWSLS